MNSQPIDHQEHSKSTTTTTTTTTSMHWKERSAHSSNSSSRMSRVLRAVISMEICSQPQCWGTCLFLVLVFTAMTILLSVSLARAKPITRIQSFEIQAWNTTDGWDASNVPCKIVSVNAMLGFSFRNPSKLFGMHVHPGPIALHVLQRSIAYGKVVEFYQPPNSGSMVSMVLQAKEVPLYGVGPLFDIPRTKIHFSIQGLVVAKIHWLWQLYPHRHTSILNCSFLGEIRSSHHVILSVSSCGLLGA
ncbi:unnamed protein product [Sphagnum jensenii]|uniref:Late embryogenesis abundant protein LEA-2 subgroup domain-containing protein n=1 Tax=Sphagnum jensenii TaxID=128206 RepID=A0ABP1BAU0_9BRYO